jgi:hypothetical protein
MDKSVMCEPVLRLESKQGLSEIQNSEDGITFISVSHLEMHKLVHESCTSKEI